MLSHVQDYLLVYLEWSVQQLTEAVTLPVYNVTLLCEQNAIS